jgi:hypothetical protein
MSLEKNAYVAHYATTNILLHIKKPDKNSETVSI